MSVVTFAVLSLLKLFARLFFRSEVLWVSRPPNDHWQDTKVAILLNHTSLLECIYVTVLPSQFLWKVARSGVFPIADVTASKKFLGTAFKFLAPNVVSLTRKRDESWSSFMEHVADDRLVLMMPEGRMRRLDGLDKDGNPMSVRGGIADILEKINGGRMLILYSSGLHHVFPPGAIFPRVFKKLSGKFESLDIDEYKKSLLESKNPSKFRKLIVADLDRRRDIWCGSLPK